MVESLQKLLDGNLGFSTHRFVPGLKIDPSLNLCVIGCVEPRVAPSLILGLELGEATTIRNIGGRVTPSVLHELGLLHTLARSAGGASDQGWTFVVLQHTDCVILRMQGQRARLAAFFGVDEGSLDAHCVADPHAAVRADVAALNNAKGLSTQMHCAGLIYSVTTGLVEIVATPE